MRPIAVLTLVLTATTIAAVAPATASATGSTEVDLGGRAFERLRAQSVKLAAKRPARLSRGVLRLPVRQGVVGSAALLNHGGALQLRKGRRVVRLTRLQTRLGGTSYVNATVRERRIRLFTLTAEPSLNPAAGSVAARNARVTLTRAGARAIKRGLKLRRLGAGRFGRATVDALVSASTPSPGGGPPAPGGPPQSGPITDEPPVLARPAGAVDLSGASVVWHVRDSWIRYVRGGEGTQALEGASPGQPIEGDQHPCKDAPNSAAPPLVYSYTLPFAHGWHDAASGQTAIYTTGGTRYSYASHDIDLTTRNLEIELTGATSRVIARFSGSGSTDPGNKRAVFFNLAAPTGGLYKGSIPEGGSQSVFGDFYAAGVGFGCVSVSYSL
jgi:hypothetical protein